MLCKVRINVGARHIAAVEQQDCPGFEGIDIGTFADPQIFQIRPGTDKGVLNSHDWEK